MRIAICDDEKIFLSKYVEIINNIKTEYNYQVEIAIFNSGEELLKNILFNESFFDLIFLDIIMEEINGVDTAKKIKQINETTEIVFLTGSKEFALSGYEVNALNYIMKDSHTIKEKIYKAMDYVYSKLNNYIVINNKSCIYKIDIRKIIYIESNRRKVAIKTTEDNYETYEKLDNMYEKVKQFGFIKCHRSYIVNMAFIKRIEIKDIITASNDIVPISRNNLDNVKSSFMSYLNTED